MPNEQATRTGLTMLLVFCSAVLMLAALLAVSLAQVTSQSFAIAAHERTIEALSEVDALLALRTSDLQAQLDGGAERVVLAGFAVNDVTVARAAAVDRAGALARVPFRAALLEAGASAVYEGGSGAFGEPTLDDPLLAGFANVLTRQRHATALVFSAGGLGATIVAGSLLMLAAGRRRWPALGLAIATGGAAVAALGLLGATALQAIEAGSEGSLRAAELAVLGALLDVPQRNGLVVAALGLTLIAVGLLRGRLQTAG